MSDASTWDFTTKPFSIRGDASLPAVIEVDGDLEVFSEPADGITCLMDDIFDIATDGSAPDDVVERFRYLSLIASALILEDLGLSPRVDHPAISALRDQVDEILDFPMTFQLTIPEGAE